MSDEPRPERRISLSFDVFAVSQRLGAYLDRALEGTGVRPAEYAVHSLMLEAGPRTRTELAAMLGVLPSTLSTYLAATAREPQGGGSNIYGDHERAPGDDRLSIVPDLAVAITWADCTARPDSVLEAALQP